MWLLVGVPRSTSNTSDSDIVELPVLTIPTIPHLKGFNVEEYRPKKEPNKPINACKKLNNKYDN